MSKKLFFLSSFVIVFSLILAGPIKADLIGWWTFDEGSGNTAFDQSGYGNDGTLNGNPTWVEGYYGGALELNNSYVAINGIADDLTENNFTVMAWIKTTMTSDGDVIGANTTGSSHDFIFGVDNNVLLVEADTINNYPPVINDGQWHHIAYTRDGTSAFAYTDGELVGTETPSGDPSAMVRWSIGMEWDSNPSDFFQGTVDDVKFFNHPLTQEEILGEMTGKGFPQAGRPVPADGEYIGTTWQSMSWRAGDFAVSHDVYMGENFDDVSNGTADTFIGNQMTTDLIVGFIGFPFPDGLVPGTTYYWRIDEVNDADPNSPWTGNVWSFTVTPLIAYNPIPADGAKFIAPDTTLSWTAGLTGKLHTAYFGETFEDVNNATGGTSLATTTFTPPGPLEAGKTYYWRVDEFDPPTTYKGDVWSFEVAAEGGGLKGEYFSGMSFNNLVLTRTDPQIDFNWGDPGGPDTTVGDDNFSCRWTGQVEAVFTETYTFYTNSDDGVRLWVDGKRLVNNWTDHGNTENSGQIDLVAGQKYSVVMEYYENTGGAVAELRWESPRTPKQIIPAAALSLLTNANTPTPANGIVGVKLQSALTWNPGEFAKSHDVYFGTDADAVVNATKASPEFKGTKQLGEESLDPGMLAFNTDYFWRVDEIDNANPDSPWVGNVWSFSTGAFLLVDDFEPYNDIEQPDPKSNRIFDKWIDGFGTTTNGALVGNDFPPYAEQSIVHGGAQSMIYRYDNANKTSEATLTLVWPRDWTAEGVTKLSLWFRGSSSNAADRLYVALNGTAVVYHDDPAATQLSGWNEWVIDLAAFGVDLTNVNSVTIGIGTKNAPSSSGGAGTVYFDDIRLVP